MFVFHGERDNCESLERSIVMRKLIAMMVVVGFILIGDISAVQAARKFRRLAVKEYVDKMKVGWIGQIIGVSWGAPAEGRYRRIMPEKNMPPFKESLINNAFGQDDLYVEMTFLRTLDLYRMDVSIRQAGIDFANSRYPLWVANDAGRRNLRSGIAPPDSSHPKFHDCAGAINYQIEADYAGLIAPGMPNVVIALGETFGRLMNYGDGLYGGQFVGGMYAEAFFEDDPVKIVNAGLKCIPRQSQYAECIRDVLKWYKQNPDDWEKTWQLINEKYHLNTAYRHFSCRGPKGSFNIDAKINDAYIVMGMLYGEDDMDKTIIISTRCGQDSDCNPANSGGILATTIGYEKLPDKFKSALNPEGKFSHTPYNFPTLIKVCEKLVRESVIRAGGRIEKDASGQEVFVIPIQRPRPTRLEQCWEPGPIANSRFTKQEMAKITATAGKDLSKAISKFAPGWKGWKVAKCGDDMNPGLLAEWAGKKNVLMTHPLSRTVGCILSKKIKIPAGKRTKLQLVVGHHPDGDWTLLVKADGKELLKKTVGRETAEKGWMQADVALSAYAGKEIKLELVNQPSDWKFEAAYRAKIELINE